MSRLNPYMNGRARELILSLVVHPEAFNGYKLNDRFWQANGFCTGTVRKVTRDIRKMKKLEVITEVLKAHTEGYSTRQIAQALDVDKSTVHRMIKTN